MSQIVLSNAKRIDIKHILQNAKQAVLTDTGIITIFAMVITLSGMMFIKNGLTQSNEAKSVAWYAANIQVAQAKNNECRRDSNATQLQSTPDCINALHAIEISFK
jgi:hypothetical protein